MHHSGFNGSLNAAKLQAFTADAPAAQSASRSSCRPRQANPCIWELWTIQQIATEALPAFVINWRAFN